MWGYERMSIHCSDLHCRINESTMTEMIVIWFGYGPKRLMEPTEGEVWGLC